MASSVLERKNTDDVCEDELAGHWCVVDVHYSQTCYQGSMLT